MAFKNFKKLQYLERKTHKPLSWFSVGPLSWLNWNLGMLVFAEGKPKNLEKNPRSKAKTNNKLNPHVTPDQN